MKLQPSDVLVTLKILKCTRDFRMSACSNKNVFAPHAGSKHHRGNPALAVDPAAVEFYDVLQILTCRLDLLPELACTDTARGYNENTAITQSFFKAIVPGTLKRRPTTWYFGSQRKEKPGKDEKE